MAAVGSSLTPVLTIFLVGQSATLSRSPFPSIPHLLCEFCRPRFPFSYWEAS